MQSTPFRFCLVTIFPTFSWLWHLFEVSCQFTPQPLYPRGKSLRYSLHRRRGGPQNRSGRHGWVKILAPHRDSKSDTLVVQPVASHYIDWAIPAVVFHAEHKLWCFLIILFCIILLLTLFRCKYRLRTLFLKTYCIWMRYIRLFWIMRPERCGRIGSFPGLVYYPREHVVIAATLPGAEGGTTHLLDMLLLG
jgi:hypothetical protein